MFEDDSVYYQRRAEVQLELAQKATLPTVCKAHYQLVEAYLDKVPEAAAVRLRSS